LGGFLPVHKSGSHDEGYTPPSCGSITLIMYFRFANAPYSRDLWS
jgi:hypothetical protein